MSGYLPEFSQSALLSSSLSLGLAVITMAVGTETLTSLLAGSAPSRVSVPEAPGNWPK